MGKQRKISHFPAAAAACVIMWTNFPDAFPSTRPSPFLPVHPTYIHISYILCILFNAFAKVQNRMKRPLAFDFSLSFFAGWTINCISVYYLCAPAECLRSSTYIYSPVFLCIFHFHLYTLIITSHNVLNLIDICHFEWLAPWEYGLLFFYRSLLAK